MKIKKNKIVIGVVVLVLLALFLIILMVFKSKNNSVVSITKDYLDSYQKLDKDIVDNIIYPFDDKLTSTHKKQFIETMKKQYEKMTYSITDQSINENDATIVVSINVYDLKSAMDRANSYIDVYKDNFTENGKFDTYKAIDYKLDALEKQTERITYSIEFHFYKDAIKWKMDDLNISDLKKIDGTY